MKNIVHSYPFLLLFISILFGFIIYSNTKFISKESHFVKLSQAFIKGDLYLSPFGLPGGDYADYKGLQFVFYGPLPSIILIPLVMLYGEKFDQQVLSFISLILIFVLIYKITEYFIKIKDDVLYLANFFVFGTVIYFLGLIPITAYTVQLVGLVFILAAIYCYFAKKNWILIGLLVSLAGMTRVTYFGAVIFFLIEIILKEKKIFKKIFLLFLPIILVLIILGSYNFRRFGSVFETGYKYNTTLNLYPLDSNLKRGVFSLQHVPTNLFILLLRSPQSVRVLDGGFNLIFPFLKANGWGMAIWFTSPLFLYLINLKKSEYTYSALISSIIIILPSLFYFGIGFSQYGYRYQLDFLPFLYIILLPTFQKGLPPLAKLMIVAGIMFNCFYMLSVWDKYPLFELFGFKQ